MIVARWEGGRDVGKKGERTKEYKSAVTKQSHDVKYSIGNRVNVVITMYGVRCVLDLPG